MIGIIICKLIKKNNIKTARKSIRDWVRTQPLNILQLDIADREVLKIAGI